MIEPSKWKRCDKRRITESTDQRFIGGSWKSALLVQQSEEAHRLAEQHVEHGPVVRELDQIDRYPLRHVLLLLPREDMLVEIILYLLVGYVDAQLLERVPGEVLEAEYVEEADRERLVVGRPVETQQTIDLIDHPVEQSAVQSFRHRVPRRTSLGDRVVSRDRLAPGHNRVRCQCLQKIALLHAEQLRH